jgi:hypothetical protein
MVLHWYINTHIPNYMRLCRRCARAGPHACEDCGGDPLCRPRCRVGTVVYRDVFYADNAHKFLRCTSLCFSLFITSCQTCAHVRTRTYVFEIMLYLYTCTYTCTLSRVNQQRMIGAVSVRAINAVSNTADPSPHHQPQRRLEVPRTHPLCADVLAQRPQSRLLADQPKVCAAATSCVSLPCHQLQVD